MPRVYPIAHFLLARHLRCFLDLQEFLQSSTQFLLRPPSIFARSPDSLIHTLPSRSARTVVGRTCNSVPFPLATTDFPCCTDFPVPAIVCMTPSFPILRTRLCNSSAIKISPASFSHIDTGRISEQFIASPPSPISFGNARSLRLGTPAIRVSSPCCQSRTESILISVISNPPSFFTKTPSGERSLSVSPRIGISGPTRV